MVLQIGQDPIRKTKGVTALTGADFLNVAQVGTVQALKDAADTGRTIQATILGYPPRFEASSGLWYADVQVGADAVYMPFVRLAVGRYQPTRSARDGAFSDHDHRHRATAAEPDADDAAARG